MRGRHVWTGTLGWAMAATLLACGGGGSKDAAATSAPAPPAAAPAGQKVDVATAGNVIGTVTLDGPAPKNEAIRMGSDPVCVQESKTPQFQETYEVGSDGKALANVFVYVKDGLGNYVYDTPTGIARLDQKGCRYFPHVFGVRVGQSVEVTNSDPTLHNVHAVPKINQEFNTGQPIRGMKTTRSFSAREVMIPFKCDVHGWMNAYVGVMDHPFFAVTDKNGQFSLKTLPPGTYTIEAWHERLGTQTQSVTLGAKETKDVTFTFKPASAVASN